MRISTIVITLLMSCALLTGCFQKSQEEPHSTLEASTMPSVESAVESTGNPMARSTTAPTDQSHSEQIPSPEKTVADWAREYGSLRLADAHNHGTVLGIDDKLSLWEEAGVNRVVLFGEVSRFISSLHDVATWKMYETYPDLIVPFFSGINLQDPADLKVARKLLEQGFFGIGEIAAASTHSPVVSNSEWKANDPMDGILPQLYELCAEYDAPLLLHIDPPYGYPIVKFEEAMEAYPNTNFIFAHANAYNSPFNIEDLLEAHPNLYIDLFAGFTAFNPGSANSLEDFVDVIRQYPDRFMLSTDSGYDMPRGEEQAIEAMYKMLDLLKDNPELVRKVAYDNLDALIRNQPATKSQKHQIHELDRKSGAKHDVSSMTKLDAGRILRNVIK